MSFNRENLPSAEVYFESIGKKLLGPRAAKWKTTGCDFHGGSDSMRVNTASGGWACMSCGESGGNVLDYEMKRTGGEFVATAKALGAWDDDGKPVQKYLPKPLPAWQALSVLAFEVTLVSVVAGNLAKGVKLSEADKQRLFIAAGRILRIAEVYQ